MNFALTVNRIKQAAFYIPFTVYFIVFSVTAILGWNMLDSKAINNDTAFADIFGLLLTIALGFSCAIISIAFITVLISWLFFLVKKRKSAVVFQIRTDVKEGDFEQKQTVKLSISPVLKPLFGFIKLRLKYDNTNFSEKFSLLEKSKRNFFSTAIEGTYHWPLPQIKEYKIEKAVLYFEDVFQFFSIAVDLTAKSNFFTHPSAKPMSDLRTSPRKTEENTTRIEQLRRVEGEYLNYKNFENNDDVRRIVWKIYAKNKELVVRVPEIMDPYASHIYLYASFFSNYDIAGSSPVEIPFLNYFKVFAWSVYQNLVKQGFEVKYIPDQELPKNNSMDKQQWVRYSISASNWQQNNDLKSYVKISDASVVIISSLSDPAEVTDLVERYGKDITFIFVKLTDSFKAQNAIEWVQWLFVKNAKNDVDVYKRAWSLSPLRLKIRENEQRLTEILEKYQDMAVL